MGNNFHILKMAALRQLTRQSDVIGSAVNYMSRVIGSHNIHNTRDQWETLQTNPYKNGIFTATKVGPQIEFRSNLSSTPALNMLMATDMGSEVDFVPGRLANHTQGSLEHDFVIYADLVVDEKESKMSGQEILVLDTCDSYIPGRWACMLDDFYFAGTGHVSTGRQLSEVSLANLTLDDVIEAYTSMPFGNIEVIQGPPIVAHIKTCIARGSLAFEKYADEMHKLKHCKGYLFGGLWGTWGDGEISPAACSFMIESNGLGSTAADDIRIDGVSEWDYRAATNGGIVVPKGHFYSLNVEFDSIFNDDYDHEPIITGERSYNTNNAVPIEELVVLGEAIRRAGGVYGLSMYGSSLKEKKIAECMELFSETAH
jgi:hypothetical protein